jgi:hypothetical protein
MNSIEPMKIMLLVFLYVIRISYIYIPNEMTKAKYGIKSDVAIILNLFTDNVRPFFDRLYY